MMDGQQPVGFDTARRRFIAGGVAIGASAALLPLTAFAQVAHRIDVHHHIFPRAIMDLTERLFPGGGRQGPPPTIKEWTPSLMLDEMDRNGVAIAIGSQPGPGPWMNTPAAARPIMRAWNEYASGLARDHRTRFGFFAMLAPPDVDGSLTEMAYALDVLKADGIGLHSNYDGKYLGDPAFAPLFDELQRRKATVYIHPTLAPCCGNAQPGIRTNMLEFPFDSTRNVVSLLFSGTLSRCPDVRFIISHAGGALPMMAGRIELLSSEYKGLAEKIPKGIPYELGRLYGDTAGTTSAASLAAAFAVMSRTHVLYGSDYPYLPIAGANSGLAASALAPDLLRAIERDNALALFPRFKS